MKKLNTEDFIRRAKEHHGDYYDYGKSKYVSFREPVTVICPVHGEFAQLASNHMKGSGCVLCSHDKLKQTTSTFISNATKVHGDYYDYSNTKLNGMNNKVTIVCPVHGEFQQRAASHIEGSGCSQCTDSHPHTADSFIENANRKHNFKYNYKNINYKNIKTKISITCPHHGDFDQTPQDHLHGYGCPACGGVKPVTRAEFIERSKKAHVDKYSYDEVEMASMNTNVIITCPTHGNFSQRPMDHVNGVGCPECSLEKHSLYNETFFTNNPDIKDTKAVLYILDCEKNDIRFCKIGVTRSTTRKRFSGKCKIHNVVEHELNLYEAWTIEQNILLELRDARFKYKNLKQIKFTGWTECFSLSLAPTVNKLTEQFIQELNNDK